MASKPLATQGDLGLAYTPGVAAACEEIASDPMNAFRFTGRGNLAGVITKGTAVVGIGTIGALASNPAMEGKAGRFKKFDGRDVCYIILNQLDQKTLV